MMLDFSTHTNSHLLVVVEVVSAFPVQRFGGSKSLTGKVMGHQSILWHNAHSHSYTPIGKIHYNQSTYWHAFGR